MKKKLALVLCAAMTASCRSACSGVNMNQKAEETTAAQSQAPQATTAAPAVETTAAPAAEGAKDWFGEADGKTPVHIKVWGGIQPEYGYADIINNFNEAYKDRGIEAEYVRYMNNTDGNTRVDLLLQGGGEDNIDVLIGYGGSTKLDQRVKSKLLLDYSQYLNDAGFDIKESLGSTAATEFAYEGGAVYGLPTTLSNSGWLMINEDMFKAAGIEIPYKGWTYSEFREAVEKLTTGEGQSKVYGICWGWNFEHSHTSGFCGETMSPFDKFKDETVKETNFDAPEWTEGLTLIKDTMDNGWAVPLDEEIAEGADTASYFLTGKCAMFLTNSQIRLAMDTATYGHTFTTGYVPHPVPDKYDGDVNQMLHANCVKQSDVISIGATSAYPEASAEFARWYITGGILPLIKGGRIPLYSGIPSEQVVETITQLAGNSVDGECIANFMSVDKNQVLARVSSPASSELGDLLWNTIQEILNDKVSVEEGMKALKEQGDALAAQYAS